MGRYLLDTNIVVFLLLSELEKITEETLLIINDYTNQLTTSSICVMEIMQLYRIGKIKAKKYKTAIALFDAIENDFYIKILPFNKLHTETLSKLKIAEKHNDPFDHSIISQAISDKLILISSDRKFNEYKNQKLLFSLNKI